MLQRFKAFIDCENLFLPDDKILLAVSGGIDSMVMLDLFQAAGFKFGIAHCNFKLRGEESEQDALFLKNIAEQYKAEYHTQSFDTSNYAATHGISVQMAARDLRYQWFEEILDKFDYNYYATAHHQDDLIETFMINLSRGTGIAGLTGIQTKLKNRIRPLLFSSRADIIQYQSSAKIEYREDSSNKEQKYVRNKIRHQLIPLFEEINPAFSTKILQTIQHLQGVEAIYLDAVNDVKKKCITTDHDSAKISIAQLNTLPGPEAFLFEFLLPYNFNSTVVKDVLRSMDGIPGKVFYSPSHRLLLDRQYLIIEPINTAGEGSQQYFIEDGMKMLAQPLKLLFETIAYDEVNIDPSDHLALLDFDLLEFPLQIRKWEEGDYFYPLGLGGRKKISDFLIDHRISVFDKEKVWLLCSGGKIAWVIGLRIDERYKLTPASETIYKVEWIIDEDA
ncbi:MAG: tRNA lysidine(34) synthetase TilS [Bacteroidota bacterium]|nr:tRNA lysidine(34) synthetase TilS [Bacteroidota bacterium]